MLVMMAQTHTIPTLTVEAGGSGVQGHPQLPKTLASKKKKKSPIQFENSIPGLSHVDCVTGASPNLFRVTSVICTSYTSSTP